MLENLKFDVVWVIDTTRSMGPYIKKVRESMINISKKIAGQENLKEKIAFGVWGYRDSATIEGLEYEPRTLHRLSRMWMILLKPWRV